MPIYEVKLRNGTTLRLDRANRLEAIRSANERADRDNTTVISVDTTNIPGQVQTAPYEADENTIQPTATGFEQQMATATAPFDTTAPFTAAPDLEERVTRVGEEDRDPYGFYSGRDTPREEPLQPIGAFAGDEGLGEEEDIDLALDKMIRAETEDGRISLDGNQLTTFGLQDGAYFNIDDGKFYNVDGTVARAANKSDLNMLAQMRLLDPDRLQGFLDEMNIVSGDPMARDLQGGLDTPTFAPDPYDLEIMDPQAAYLRGLQAGGAYGEGGAAGGPKTGYQRYLESLQDPYETAYGLSSLLAGLQPEQMEQGELWGVDPEATQKGLLPGGTFEDFVKKMNPDQMRALSGSVLQDLRGYQAEEGGFQGLMEALNAPVQSQQRQLQNLAVSALRGQISPTAFSFIAQNLPSADRIMSGLNVNRYSGTGAPTPTFIDELARQYGLGEGGFNRNIKSITDDGTKKTVNFFDDNDPTQQPITQPPIGMSGYF